MTGFGKATLQLPTKKITVEIKSLNSKGLDLNTRMPYVFREMELGLRNQLSQKLERGKVDFSLYIDQVLLRGYKEELFHLYQKRMYLAHFS